MATNTYTPAQKAAYKVMRAEEKRYEHTGRTLESLTQIAQGMKATGDAQGLKLLSPVLKHTLVLRQQSKPLVHQARAAYYALFVQTPEDVTLSDDESAAFAALVESLDATEED